MINRLLTSIFAFLIPDKAPPGSHLTYRADIDGLRAVAVLMVVVFHFIKGLNFNGYMGVDIFFVISGYLITKIIYKDALTGHFSIKTFYERRIRRIFPALFVVVGISTVIAILILMPVELAAYAKSAITSIFFSSNILFYSETGYFDASADLKPLLHTWSLAVEEQFYILYPPLIVFLLKRYKDKLLQIISGLFISSFLLAILTPYFTGDNDLTFYMFPMRAWELLAGAAIALNIIPKPDFSKTQLNNIALFSVFLIGLSLLLNGNENTLFALYVFPAIIGTALIIYTGEYKEKTLVKDALSHPVMTFFGKISYSLYLWHWPIYVFALYYNFDILSKMDKIGLIGLSVIIAYLSWRFIEQPYRKKSLNIFSIKQLTYGLTVGLFIICCSSYLIANKGLTPWMPDTAAKTRDIHIGGEYTHISFFDNTHDFIFGTSENTDNATVVLIGDSHAQAISPAIQKQLLKSGQTGLMFRNGCLALPSNKPVAKEFTACKELSRKHADFLKKNDNIKTVIIAQRWAARTKAWHTKYGAEKDFINDYREQTLKSFIEEIAAPGRQIIILAQVPLATKGRYNNFPSIHARMSARNHPDTQSLAPTRNSYYENQGQTLGILKRVSTETGAHVIWPHETLCPEQNVNASCKILDEGGYYYYDDDHISRYGANQLSHIFDAYF